MIWQMQEDDGIKSTYNIGVAGFCISLASKDGANTRLYRIPIAFAEMADYGQF